MRIIFSALLSLVVLSQAAALAQTTADKTAKPQSKPAGGGKQATPAKPAQQLAKPNAQTPKPAPPVVQGPTVAVAADYAIGAEDVLGVLFWRDTEMSGDVTVRPDGMVTLPIVRDIKAAGLTPTQLADKIQEAAREYVTDASVTVVVRQINSRKVFITGEVAKPGSYPISASSMTVMQLIAVAGGLTEWAQSKSITVMRLENGKSKSYPFNYRDVAKGKKAEQNLVLRPGDTVVVPEK
jgi:polysaccharide biosynthesis/export protein